jgi:HEAT repeat protein
MAEDKLGIEKREDTDQLILMLHKGNYIEQMNAIYRLKIRKEEKAVVPLINALNGAGYLQQEVIDALIKMGDMTVEPMKRCWPSLYKDTQKYLIYVLKTIGTDKAVDALIYLMNYQENLARDDAAYALGHIGGKKAVEPLIKALNDDNFSVRVAAYEALENMDTNDIDLVSIVREVETECVKMESEALDMMRTLAERKPIEPISVTVGGGGMSKRKPTLITMMDQNEFNRIRYAELHLSFSIYVWRMMKIAQKKMT